MTIQALYFKILEILFHIVDVEILTVHLLSEPIEVFEMVKKSKSKNLELRFSGDVKQLVSSLHLGSTLINQKSHNQNIDIG